MPSYNVAFEEKKHKEKKHNLRTNRRRRNDEQRIKMAFVADRVAVDVILNEYFCEVRVRVLLKHR